MDVEALLSKKPPEDVLIDDGSGKVEIFLIDNYQKTPFPSLIYGQFFSGDCFLVLYSYFWKNTEKTIVYFWQGRDSTIVRKKKNEFKNFLLINIIVKNQKGTSAYLTKDTAHEMQNDSSQIRVVQNMEPAHFLLIFQKSYIIHKGRYSNYDPSSGVALFTIFGENEKKCRAVGIEEVNLKFY